MMGFNNKATNIIANNQFLRFRITFHKKVIMKVATLIFLLLLLVSSVQADNHEILINDQTFENSQDVWTYFNNDPIYITDIDNLNWAFEDDPEKTWDLLSNNPNYLLEPDVLNKAFSEDITKSFSMINDNIDLIDNSNVLMRIDSEIKSSEQDTPKQVEEKMSLLNNNLELKENWINKQYGINMKDSSVEILSYDGAIVTTGGEKGMSFNAQDIKEISGEYYNNFQILEDGSLSYSAIKFTPKDNPEKDNGLDGGDSNEMSLSVLRDDNGDIMRNSDDIPILHVKGGTVNPTGLAEGEIGDALFIENGELIVDKGNEIELVYSGTFEVESIDRETVITSKGEPVKVLLEQGIVFGTDADGIDIIKPFEFSFEG